MTTLDEKTLLILAQRAAGKFRGRFPNGITAGDCVNDCVVRLIELSSQADDRVPDGVNLYAWLVTRCHGDVRDAYARAWKKDNQIRVACPLNESLPVAGREPPHPAVGLDVRAAVERLTGVERDVMRLVLVGRTQEQIAEAICHTQPSVSQIMSRAKPKLAQYLEAYADE